MIGLLHVGTLDLRSRVKRHALSLLLLLFTATQTGCLSSKLAKAFTMPPNGGKTSDVADLPLPEFYDAVNVIEAPGPPPIRLAYWTKEPTGHTDHGTPRATVVLVHGYGSKVRSSKLLAPVTSALADAGCRVILPDLRGHGDSTGDYISAGRLEVEDLKALLDHLQTQGQLSGPLGVGGHSYGGGVALQLAAVDPRVERVLGLSPLVDIRPTMHPGVHFVLRQKYTLLYHMTFRWIITQNLIDRAQVKMGERTGTDLNVHNALVQTRKITVPILILQGGKDFATPPIGPETLQKENPDYIELHVYPEGDHVNYFVDDREDLQRRVTEWAEALEQGV